MRRPAALILLSALVPIGAAILARTPDEPRLAIRCAQTGEGVAATALLGPRLPAGEGEARLLRADAGGRVDLPEDWAGRPLRVDVRAPGFAGVRRTLPPEAGEVTIELEPHAILEGVVRGIDGEAVPGAELLLVRFRRNSAVGIEQPFPHLELLDAVESWHEDDLDGTPTSERADGLGRFRIPVPPGMDVDLVARLDGVGCGRMRVAAQEPGAVATLEPRLAPFTGVRGRAPVTPDGAPWFVTLFAMSGGRDVFHEEARLWARPGAEYAIREIGPGPKLVVLTRSADNVHEVRWTQTSVELERTVEVETPPLRSGSVLCRSDGDFEDGLPVELSLTFAPYGEARCSVLSRGRFDPARPLRILGTAPGHLTLRARSDGGEEASPDAPTSTARGELVTRPEGDEFVLQFETSRPDRDPAPTPR